MSESTKILAFVPLAGLLSVTIPTSTDAVAKASNKAVASATAPLVKTPLTRGVVLFSFIDAVGRWHAPNGSTTFEFKSDGTIIDNLHNVQGKSSGKLARGGNLAVAYPTGQACYYTALLQKDGKKLFLAEKTPKAPKWPCFTGALVKSY